MILELYSYIDSFWFTKAEKYYHSIPDKGIIMTSFQLLLMIVSGVVFYMFFKQVFSGSHPKRGIDFEAKVADEQVGGISRPDKIFSKPDIPIGRLEELYTNADKAVENGDYEEAKKALGSALILDAENSETLYKLAYAHLNIQEYAEAKGYLEKILVLDDSDDMAHAMLANVLHQQKEEDLALAHHLRAIELDNAYAPHYFNYANTLYELDRIEEALVAYKQAYTLDHSLDKAKEMISKISE